MSSIQEMIAISHCQSVQLLSRKQRKQMFPNILLFAIMTAMNLREIWLVTNQAPSGEESF
jgi:hypothetical protein